MTRLLRAELWRLRKSCAFWLSLLGMLVLAAFFMVMQATGMDYTVPLSRVIFLPLSLYGVAMSAFVSVFVGADFSDGFIRNKLLAAEHRRSLVLSSILVSSAACLIIYTLVTAFSAGLGQFFFENNVEGSVFFRYYLLGVGMSLLTGCLFSVMTLLCGNQSRAIVLCMGLAFLMLFLCLHTNEVLVQTPYKDGLVNPRYVAGFRRTLCSILHDLNPCGQAAQLSAWELWHPVRMACVDLVGLLGLTGAGCLLFEKEDIR